MARATELATEGGDGIPPGSILPAALAAPAFAGRGGERWRAPYAADPSRSRGRLHSEPDDPLRSPFQRDRDRVIHSNAFRRLKHKTQVFIHHEGDHFRTRLSHTLEVAQIARSLARPLGLDEDLAEALALAHDLGHPPFGHAGERALDAALAAHGGFDHNLQSLRVVTELERRYPDFDGLNLTFETLEGLAKHNGPLTDTSGHTTGKGAGAPLPAAILALATAGGFALDGEASLEAQAAALADDIAYDTHDLDDGLRAGLIPAEALEAEPLAGPILKGIRDDHPRIEPARAVHELVRRLIRAMIADVLAETGRRIADRDANCDRLSDQSAHRLLAFSPVFAEAELGLKAFLFRHLYRHPEVMSRVRLAETVVGDLIGAFVNDPKLLPDTWRAGLDPAEPSRTARRVADYVAGMTDRYALSEHRRLFDATPDLGQRAGPLETPHEHLRGL